MPALRPERRFWVAALALATLGTLHGLVYVPFAGPRLGDSPGYTAAADALRAASYTTPLPAVDVTGYEFHPAARGAPERQTYRTPGYPALLAVTGHGGRRPLVLVAAQALLTGASILLLALVIRRAVSERAALAAAALLALDPFTKHYVPRIMSEVLAGFLAVATAYAFARAWPRASLPWWALAGVLSAALALTRPVFAFLVPLLALAAVASRGDVRSRLTAALACVAASAVLLGPWLAWEHAATGRWTIASFGQGWNLLFGAHGEGLARTAVEVASSPAFRRDFDSVHVLAPPTAELRSDPTAHPRYLGQADVEQVAAARRLYRDRLREAPHEVVGEIAYRAYFLWMVREDWRQPGGLADLGLRLLYWLALVLAISGLVIAFRAGGIERALAIAVVAFTAISAFHHVEARYAIPVRGLYLAFVGLALLSAFDAVRGVRASRG